MTSDTLTFIEVSDILALHFECKSCKATVSRPIAELLRLPPSCGNCNADWMGLNDSLTKQTLEQFAHLLGRLAVIAEKKDFRFRLQVTTPKIMPSVS